MMTWKSRLWLLYAAIVVPLVALTYLATVYVERRVERTDANARLQTLEVFSHTLDDQAVRARKSLDRLARYLERPGAVPLVESSLNGTSDGLAWSQILTLLPLDPMPERLLLVDPVTSRVASFVELDGKSTSGTAKSADTISVVTTITGTLDPEEARSLGSIASSDKTAWVRYLPGGKLETGIRFSYGMPVSEPRPLRRRGAVPPPTPVVRFIVADYKWADFVWRSVPPDAGAEFFVTEPTTGALLFRTGNDQKDAARGAPASSNVAELQTSGHDVQSTMIPNLGVAAGVRYDLDASLGQRTRIIWLVVAAFILMLGVAVATHARELTQGLQEIEAGVSAYTAGRFAHRVPLWSQDELGRAGRALNAMAAQLDRGQRATSVTARQDVMTKLKRRIGREVGDVATALDHVGRQLQSEAVPRAVLRGAGEVTLRLAERVRAIESEIPEIVPASFWRPDLPLEPIELPVVLDEAVAASRVLTRPDIDVKRVVPPSVPPLRLPRAPLSAVFRSIFDNAVRAMPKGGMLKIEVTTHSRFVVVVVIDSGFGMSPEFVSGELFQAFSCGWPNEDGLGLSLHRARQFLRALGGELEAASHEGVGTRITARLPLPAAASSALRQPADGAVAKPISTLGNPASLSQN